MNPHEAGEKLSTQAYWDEVLSSAQLPRVNSNNSYLYSVTMRFIHDTLKNASYKTFFEVGCGSSGWLPYFAGKYNYIVSGLDYSDIGCMLAKKNLELLNIRYGEILCKDFFQPAPTNGQVFDVIFSYGVIEHFNEPAKIVGIFKSFTTADGLIITLVPNFTGLAGRLTKYFIKDIYDIHNVITTEQLASYHIQNGLEIIKNRYAGIFAFGVIPWIRSKHWLFKENTLRRKTILFIFRAFDRVMGKIFRILPFDLPSSFFSPYLICIAKKK